MPINFRTLTISLFVWFLFANGSVQAEEVVEIKIPENSVLSDGMISKEEMASYMVVANQQLAYLAKQAMNEYEQRISSQGDPMPSGWMLMKDGVTVKELKLDDSANGAPANIRMVMFRAALKSIARRGQISAAALVFSGPISESNPQKVLAIEHEHRVGVSATKYIPFEEDGGNMVFGKAVTQEKPFQLFYDSQWEAPVQK